MERSTRKIPAGEHEIVIYDYITGGEHLRLQDVFLSRMEVSRFSGTDGNPQADVKGLTGSVAVESVKLAIEMLVVSVDGKTENVVSEILKLPLAEYEIVKKALDEVADGGKKKIAGDIASYTSGSIRGEMIKVAICEHMGWTYQEYMSCPAWFISLLIKKFEVDKRNEQRAMKKLK